MQRYFSWLFFRRWFFKRLSLFFLFLAISSPTYSQTLNQDSLVAEIMIPYANSLVRGDVPVYGVAYGEDFKEYILEYGAGLNPNEWTVINRSSHPEKDVDKLSKVRFDLVKTVPGNLGMWITGLSEYKYKDYDVDLPIGVYTLRLRVIGQSGEEIESRVKVDVGRVALNCASTELDSPDGRSSLYIPEHSLGEVAKVFSLTALNQIPKRLRDNKEISLISSLYRLRPAGEQLYQKALLKIFFNPAKVFSIENISICVYDTDIERWKIQDSHLNEDENSLETQLESIPHNFAVYGVFEGQNINRKNNKSIEHKKTKPITSILCSNTFENGLDQWRNKHGSKGASLNISEQECLDGYCLKIINQSEKGNFAALAYNQVFDVRKYSYIDFDYKMNDSVRVNLLVKVNGQWFDIVFTDDAKVYWDIHMQKAGELQGVIQDGQWHHMRFNLFEMLKEHTDDYLIEEVVFADWDSTGFKQLEFGKTPQGTFYFIDNFKISSNQYFWQIGWKDHSSKEFNKSTSIGTEDFFIIGQESSVLPGKWDSFIKLKFTVPEDIHETSYRLTVKFTEPLQSIVDSNIMLVHNQNEISEEYEKLTSSRMDFLLEKLSLRENKFLLINTEQPIEIDYIELVPIGEIPWKIESFSEGYGSDNIFVGEEFEERDKQPLNSSIKEKLNIFFVVSNTPTNLSLELIPNNTDGSSSWLNLDKVDIYLNDILLKKIIYGSSAEPIYISISSDLLKEGINSLKFIALPSSKISFKKILLVEDL